MLISRVSRRSADGRGVNTPDVGEGARQVDNKSPAEQWRAGVGCHLVLRLAVFLIFIE